MLNIIAIVYHLLLVIKQGHSSTGSSQTYDLSDGDKEV